MQYTRNIDFYADLQESNSEKITNSSDVQKYSNTTKDSQDVNTDSNELLRDSQDVNNEWEAQVLLYKTSLMDIVEDLTKRLMEGDQQIYKFLQTDGKFPSSPTALMHYIILGNQTVSNNIHNYIVFNAL